MQTEGPALAVLVKRLSECPPIFLEEPRIGGKGKIHVDAVLYDLLNTLGPIELSSQDLIQLSPPDARIRNLLRIRLICAWLLHDEWFRMPLHSARIPSCANAARLFLLDGLKSLADRVQAEHFVTDGERREELARLTLAALGLRPQGESIQQATDRLTALDTIERQRVLEQTRRLQEELEQRRLALQQQAALEAAAKISRE